MDRHIKSCMDTWDICGDYEVVEWNEDNCNLNENSFISVAVKNSKWAFVSDYFRLKALYKIGGIYLDTDVEIKNTFNDLLGYRMFLGYIFDCSIGTAVIGSEKGHPFLKYLLDLYKNAYWNEDLKTFSISDFPKIKFKCNNDVLTYALKKYNTIFKLNGKTQFLSDLVIFQKEEFEIGPVFGIRHAVHRCEASWKDNSDSLIRKIKYKIKRSATLIPFIDGISLIRHVTYREKMKKESFYRIYLEDSMVKSNE
ncbi:MAG: glycosyltransferase [Liquorilactobacillus hordei]|uniref:glycosyltransferase family 32 protein n=1 Tax=Liquorilactobacillus hordei TaxID=468911 RepID=UPI0039EBD1DA